MTEISGRQLDALASWLATLRPAQRDWTVAACRDAAWRASLERTSDPVELAIALSRGAARPNLVDPAQLADDGPQWDTEIITTHRRIELYDRGHREPVRTVEPHLQGELL